MSNKGLKGKVVLVTGANNPLGIGAATARAFARIGANVFITFLPLSPEPRGVTVDEAERATKPGGLCTMLCV